MIEIDDISSLVTTDTDLTMAELERRVLKEGYTLNYFTPPENNILLADVLWERRPNLYAQVFGGIEDLCIQVRLSQSDGQVFSNVMTPRSATGPSLKKLAIGSVETLGIPFQATLKLFPKPTVRRLACVLFPSRRNLEVFSQNLKKQRLALPLMHRLPAEKIKDFYPDIQEGEAVLGLAHWGSTPVVDALWKSLQDQANAKNAKWFEVEGGKLVKDFFQWLQQEAAAPWGMGKTLGEAGLSPSHLKLMKRIKKLA